MASTNIFPHNFTTGMEYSGANISRLTAAQETRGYATAEWCTYKQAQAAGWQVRKGEKGVRCMTVVKVDKRKDGSGKRGTAPKGFTVFNIAQMDKIAQEATAAA